MQHNTHKMLLLPRLTLLLGLAALGGCGTGRVLIGDVQDTFPPGEEVSVTPTTVTEGDDVTFYLDAEIKVPSEKLAYAWDFDFMDAGTAPASGATPALTISALPERQAATAHCSVTIRYTLGLQTDEVQYSFDVLVNPRTEPVPPAELLLYPIEVEAGQTVTFSTNLIAPADVTVTYAWDFSGAADTALYTAASPEVVIKKLRRSQIYDPALPIHVEPPAEEQQQVSLTVTYYKGGYSVSKTYNSKAFKLTIQPHSPGLQVEAISPTAIRISAEQDTSVTFSYLLAAGEATEQLWDFGSLGNPTTGEDGVQHLTVPKTTPAKVYPCKLVLENAYEILSCSFNVTAQP